VLNRITNVWNNNNKISFDNDDNDIFSKSLHIWHSGWDFDDSNRVTANGHVYPFGLDPGWHGAQNALVFTNSYKMKMSIIIGVIHMTFAICLQIPNHIHFKRQTSIWAEFIPQILFLHSIFGYLVVCIILKWATDWSKASIQPPALLTMLIYMFLSPGSLEPKDQMFPGQGPLQVFLLLLAAVCVPWMLCTKPYLAWKEMKAHEGQGYGRVELRDDAVLQGEEEGDGAILAEQADEDDEEHHDFGEVIIHQVIHTIEFCLGCISNTASYLRLWALSLAHAQLSEVLWSMTIGQGLNPSGFFGYIFLAALGVLWFFLTICILCIMEGLSAFLHALRLHWVEANGKHYEAGGYAFQPLTFARTLVE